MDSDVLFAPTTDLAEAIRTGERSAVDVTEAYLDRIDARDPDLDACLTVAADSAREAAQAGDEAATAGAVVLCETTTPEFGHRSTTDNRLAGPTRDPLDLESNAGGSSEGSAAAVAAGVTTLER